MNYTEQQFFRLIEAIEDDGGELTDELCQSRAYNMVGPKSKRVILPGCGNTAIFEVPYEDAERSVKLCAVCDDLGGTPRFGHVMRGG